MRELHLKMSVSADGFVAGLNGEIDWMVASRDEAVTGWLVDTLSNASVHVMGSHTYQEMAAWWPTSTEPVAGPMNAIGKTVFSSRGDAVLVGMNTLAALRGSIQANAAEGRPTELVADAETWTESYVASGDLRESIARMKRPSGKPMLAHGGVSFARSLVKTGLIDEYHLLVHPVVLGQGVQLFSELEAPMRLELKRSTAFPKGAVALSYRPR